MKRLTENGALKEGVSIHEAVQRLCQWEETGLFLHEAHVLAMMHHGIRATMMTAYRHPVTGEPTGSVGPVGMGHLSKEPEAARNPFWSLNGGDDCESGR